VKELHQLKLGITKVTLTLIYVILTRYCHIASQRGRDPTHVQVGILDNKGGVEGVVAQQNEDVI
jgi:hypothetical protein